MASRKKANGTNTVHLIEQAAKILCGGSVEAFFKLSITEENKLRLAQNRKAKYQDLLYCNDPHRIAEAARREALDFARLKKDGPAGCSYEVGSMHVNYAEQFAGKKSGGIIAAAVQTRNGARIPMRVAR